MKPKYLNDFLNVNHNFSYILRLISLPLFTFQCRHFEFVFLFMLTSCGLHSSVLLLWTLSDEMLCEYNLCFFINYQHLPFSNVVKIDNCL